MLFTSDKDDAAARQPKSKIYMVDLANPTATELISTATPGFKQGYVVSGRGNLSFSQDGTRIFFSRACRSGSLYSSLNCTRPADTSMRRYRLNG